MIPPYRPVVSGFLKLNKVGVLHRSHLVLLMTAEDVRLLLFRPLTEKDRRFWSTQVKLFVTVMKLFVNFLGVI